MRSWLFALGWIVAAATPLQAAVALKDGKLIDARFVANRSLQEHYQAGLDAVECQNWNEAVVQFQTVVINFPDSRFAEEARYYLGVSYFYLQDYDLANQNLSLYLQLQSHPKHFREAMQYKFAVAEKFAQGARRHVFGWETMPKWLTSKELAVNIFDEVAAAMPNDEIAAKAYFGKAQLLASMGLFKEAIEAYQTVIKKFPKNPLAPECYLEIARAYVCEGNQQKNNPDLLGLAQVNIKRFRQDFPGDERIAEAEAQLLAMQESCAMGLYETGRFYERTKHPKASALYYKSTIQNYPMTHAASLAKYRLEMICPAPKEGGTAADSSG